jgi:glycosyltransferase involved in cell wall biosynthesis
MISIIIPTYNRASILLKTLPSYLAQENVSEIIIVDDGSTDSTEEVVNKFQSNIDIRYFKHSSHKGAASARFTGINAAKNQYIVFGEDDVIFDNDYVSTLYNDMIAINADIIAGRIIYLNENESHEDAVLRYNNLNKSLINYNRLIGEFGLNIPNPTEVPFVHACFLAKKEVYSKMEYDVNYPGNGFREETDPQILALIAGRKIIFTPNTCCYHLPRPSVRTGGQRMSDLKIAYWTTRNNIYFLKKHHAKLAQRYNLRPLWMMILGGISFPWRGFLHRRNWRTLFQR